MSELLPTIDQVVSVAQSCRAAIGGKAQLDFYRDQAKELEAANASLQRAVIEDERTITRLQRELADVTRERDRLRAVARRAKSGQRRRARRCARRPR